MQTDARSGCDWRDPAAYAPLLGADRSLIAWEWLRRDPAYCDLAGAALSSAPGFRAQPAPARFGLVAFEDPDARVPDARPLWSADVHPLVLPVAAAPAGAIGDAFDLTPFFALARIVRDRSSDHLLLCDGFRTVRLDAPAGTFGGGPRWLCYRLAGLSAAERPLLTLRRFLSLAGSGRFARTLHPVESSARRWILMLRAHDALAAGATQREIATALLSPAAGARRWRSEAPSIRSQAQRLARSARAAAAGGYRALLR